jgi:hypothetical protein
MRPTKLSVRGLMALISLVAVGFAALSHPTRLWASALYTSAIVVLSLAVVAGLRGHRRESRAFWTGFAACGWIYFALHFGPWFRPQYVPSASRGWEPFAPYRGEELRVCPPLLTTALLDAAYPSLVRGVTYPLIVRVPESIHGAGTISGGGEMVVNPSKGTWQRWIEADTIPDMPMGLISSASYQQAGHSVICLVLAMFGGAAARRLAGREEATPAGP